MSDKEYYEFEDPREHPGLFEKPEVMEMGKDPKQFDYKKEGPGMLNFLGKLALLVVGILTCFFGLIAGFIWLLVAILS